MLAPDLELKRILWALLSDLSKSDADNMETIMGSELIETLLMYLSVDLQPGSGEGEEGEGAGVDGYLMETDQMATGVAAAGPAGMEAVSPGMTEGDAADAGFAGDGMGEGGDPLSPGAGMGGGMGMHEEVVLAHTPMIITRLPRTQLRVLQQQAMAVLLNLAPRAPDKFQDLSGHIITLRFLDACSKSGGEARSLVQGSLMLLLSFVGLPGLQDELGQLDAVRIMLGRFTDLNSSDALRADAACILSRLCQNHVQNQATLRQSGGIVALVDQMEMYCRSRQPAKRTKKGELAPGSFGMSGGATEKLSPLMVGVVDCLWNAVVGNSRSEARLLTVGGMDALLNMLEVCPVLMRHQLTGIIADLCENRRIVPYVRAWRSDRTMVTAVELFCHHFEDEEVRLNVSRPDGVILNLWSPLRSHEGVSLSQPTAPLGDGSGSVGGGTSRPNTAGGGEGGSKDGGTSVGSGAPIAFQRLSSALQQSPAHKAERQLRRAIETQDLRAKITAVLECVGFEFAAENLAANERSALLMAQYYVAFRAGENWAQVRSQLRNENVKPIAADAILLENKLEEVFNTSRHVKCQQMHLSEESVEDESRKEAAFFDTILLQRDQEIRQEQIKRSALVPKSLQKRKAEKEAKKKMLAKSLVPQASSDVEGLAGAS